MTPDATSAETVTMLRSCRESTSFFDQTSPKRISSLYRAKSGAKSPSLSRPAVCTTLTASRCSAISATPIVMKFVVKNIPAANTAAVHFLPFMLFPPFFISAGLSCSKRYGPDGS